MPAQNCTFARFKRYNEVTYLSEWVGLDQYSRLGIASAVRGTSLSISTPLQTYVSVMAELFCTGASFLPLQRVMNIHSQHCTGSRACPPASRYANASNNALASCRSVVSNPSVNQPYTGSSSCRTSSRLPWDCHRRLRLRAARSSQALACCWRAIATA